MKNFKRVLSLVLAAMMCLSLVSLSAFAADEEAADENVVFELDFEGLEAGKDMQTYADQYIGNTGYLQPINKIMQDTNADGSKNTYLRLPFAGHCIVTSAGSRPADLDGNADKSLYPKHEAFDYTKGESLIIETSYRWDAKDVAPQLQTQFHNITAYTKDAEGNISATTTTGNWISLYTINGSTLSLGSCGTLTGAGELVAGEWNTVRLVIDLAEARYDTYLNGVLYATDAYLSQSGGSDASKGYCNVSVGANKLIIAKMNKMLNTYSAQTVYDDWDVYFDVDDINVYFTDDLIDVNVNGRDMKVFPNQELIFKKSGQSFIYAEIKDGDKTTINTNGKFTVDKAGYEIVAYYGATGALGYEGYEMIAEDATKGKINEIYGANSLAAAAGAYELVTEVDAETLANVNSLKVKLSDAVNGKGITMRHGAIDTEKNPVVNLFSKITPAAGAGVEIKLGDKTIYTVKGNEIAGLTKAEGAPAIEAGKLVDMKTVINLQKGTVDVYVLAEVVAEEPAPAPAPAAEGDAAAGEGEAAPAEPVYEYVLYGSVETTVTALAENAISYVIAKDGAFVANSELVLGTFALEDGDKVQVELIWDKYSEVQYNADGTPKLDAEGNPVLKWFQQSSKEWYHVGTTYDLTRAARTFQSATITYPLPEGADKDAVAEQEVINAPALEITKKLSGASVDLVYSLAIVSATFENVVVDETTGVIQKGGDVNAAAHIYSAVREENGNKYIHVPYQGTAKAGSGAWGTNGSGNFDKALQIAHSAIAHDKTETVVLEMDYRLHYVELTKGTGTEAGKIYSGYDYNGNLTQPLSQIQLQKVNAKEAADATATKDLSWADLVQINVATGEIKQVTKVDGAENIAQDTWTTIKLVITLKDGTFSVYTNDVLYGTGKISKGVSDYTIIANTLYVGKCNKMAGAYKTLCTPDQLKDAIEQQTTAVDNSENITYVDVDNVTFRYIEDRQISIDGSAQKVQETDIVDLTEEGKNLLFATITLDGKTTITTDTKIVPVNGMKIQRYTVANFATLADEMLRVGAPTGIRFVSVVDPDFTNLIYNDIGLTVKFGTIIAPAAAVEAAEEFTKAGLTTVDAEGNVTATNYLEVLGIAGKTFYDRSIKDDIGENYAFAGSIANIKEANLEKKFVGRGFIEVYEGEGEDAKLVASMYADVAEDEKGACISDLVFKFLDSSKSDGIGPKFRAYLESYMVEE